MLPPETTIARHFITQTKSILLFRVILLMHITTQLLVGKLSLITISMYNTYYVLRTINVTTLPASNELKKKNKNRNYYRIKMWNSAWPLVWNDLHCAYRLGFRKGLELGPYTTYMNSLYFYCCGLCIYATMSDLSSILKTNYMKTLVLCCSITNAHKMRTHTKSLKQLIIYNMCVVCSTEREKKRKTK